MGDKKDVEVEVVKEQEKDEEEGKTGMVELTTHSGEKDYEVHFRGR